MQDHTHDGYLIPEGAILMPNIWSVMGFTTSKSFLQETDRQMCRDPKVYKDIETFDPSRFLGPEPEQDPGDFIFGFGRRYVLICKDPGVYACLTLTHARVTGSD